MNDLIKVEVNENQEPVVRGRELHRFLGIQTAYKDWFPRMCEYGFVEGQDFNSLIFEQVQTEGSREVKRQIQDHLIKIDMAKELCMIQRTERGKEARQYFIQIEKKFNSPEITMARALIMANGQIEQLKLKNGELNEKIEEMRPQVEFAEAVTASVNTILIRDLAKILFQNGTDTGEKRLFAFLREEGYLTKSKKNKNTPTQKAMRLGLFETHEVVVTRADGLVTTQLITKVTGKGQQYFTDRFLKGNKVFEQRLIRKEEDKQAIEQLKKDYKEVQKTEQNKIVLVK